MTGLLLRSDRLIADRGERVEAQPNAPGRPRLSRLLTAWPYIVPLLVLSVVYGRTVQRSTGNQFSVDTTKFDYLGLVLGTAHPPGYPLYTMLNAAFVRIVPWGSVAFRANLLSAVFAILACLVAVRIFTELGVRPVVAAGGATALGSDSAAVAFRPHRRGLHPQHPLRGARVGLPARVRPYEATGVAACCTAHLRPLVCACHVAGLAHSRAVALSRGPSSGLAVSPPGAGAAPPYWRGFSSAALRLSPLAYRRRRTLAGHSRHGPHLLLGGDQRRPVFRPDVRRAAPPDHLRAPAAAVQRRNPAIGRCPRVMCHWPARADHAASSGRGSHRALADVYRRLRPGLRHRGLGDDAAAPVVPARPLGCGRRSIAA